MPLTATRRRRAPRVLAAPVLAAIMATTVAAPAMGATSQSSTQAISGTPTPELVATFPSAFTFASLTPSVAATSPQQTVNVKSNVTWGLRVSADNATLRRWNGSAYVAGSLSSALQWARTSLGGTPVGSPTYASIATSTADVIAGQAVTADAGVDVGVTFRQPVSYTDNASIGTDTYRVVVTYAAGQGF